MSLPNGRLLLFWSVTCISYGAFKSCHYCMIFCGWCADLFANPVSTSHRTLVGCTEFIEEHKIRKKQWFKKCGLALILV
ncbi:hypothetical protein Zmor_019324 [Zophobas morio]|uniref:Secreted protein n=1 Tax=Zophobas morio TaxID=2755281 RepID=A0AA38I1U6_9CUCU|nr:hypothetical protein Zmor_019324 [Zophobas morio]